MNLKIVVLLMFGCLLVIHGCAMPKGSVGRYVPPDDVVSLKDSGVHSGTWQTFDMLIDYEYEIDGSLLIVSGKGELSEHYKLLYYNVRYLWLYLLLLDSEGIILESISLPVHLLNTEDSFQFKQHLKYSGKVNGFSFSYRGMAYEFDSQGIFSFP